jgi:ditrans,polycis-polyprenyl diphosphate synthase
MLSRFLSVTARRTRHPARRLLHAGAGAVVAPPPQALVQSGIRPESLPRHVAVVTDGNRRWAQARGMLTAEGHEAGRRALERTIWLSHSWGIRALTVFAFSQENFGRPKAWIFLLPSLTFLLSSAPTRTDLVFIHCSCIPLNLKMEVDYLMGMIERTIRDNIDEYAR